MTGWWNKSSPAPYVLSGMGVGLGLTKWLAPGRRCGAPAELLLRAYQGDDTLMRKGNRVYVFSLLSTEANRTQALPAFKAFIDSAQLP